VRRRPGSYLRKLRSILRYLGTCDGNMGGGASLRCDCNRLGAPPGRTLRHALRDQETSNSVRYVMQAIDYEARRQVDTLEEGGRVEQADASVRRRARHHPADAPSKEEAHGLPLFSPIPTCCHWSSTREMG